MLRVIGLVGWSGSGKTTLVCRLLPLFIARGVTVSTLKHAHHGFDVDQPGKDSWEHRAAGAVEVLVSSAKRFALMRELRGAPEPTLPELLARMAPVDLVLVEGFKRESHPKIEIYRQALGKPALYPSDRTIVAVASDVTLPDAPVPVLSLADIPDIASFALGAALPLSEIHWRGEGGAAGGRVAPDSEGHTVPLAAERSAYK